MPSAIGYVGYKTDVSTISTSLKKEKEEGARERECMREEIRRKESVHEGDKLERSVSVEANTLWLLLVSKGDSGLWSSLMNANPGFSNRVNTICAANEEAIR